MLFQPEGPVDINFGEINFFDGEILTKVFSHDRQFFVFLTSYDTLSGR